MTPAPAINLQILCRDLRVAAFELSAQPVDVDLTAARLMDVVRDEHLPCISPADWPSHARVLDVEGWRRLSMLIQVLRSSDVSSAMRTCLKGKSNAAEATVRFCGQDT